VLFGSSLLLGPVQAGRHQKRQAASAQAAPETGPLSA
jgi:hypothetical protein